MVLSIVTDCHELQYRSGVCKCLRILEGKLSFGSFLIYDHALIHRIIVFVCVNVVCNNSFVYSRLQGRVTASLAIPVWARIRSLILLAVPLLLHRPRVSMQGTCIHINLLNPGRISIVLTILIKAPFLCFHLCGDG